MLILPSEIRKVGEVTKGAVLDAINALYNDDSLMPELIQDTVNRVADWLYGITAAGRIVEVSPEGEKSALIERLDSFIVAHRSTIRSGYALRVAEEKLMGQRVSIGHEINLEELIKEGGALIEKSEKGSPIGEAWSKDFQEGSAEQKRLLYLSFGLTFGHAAQNSALPTLLPKSIFDEIWGVLMYNAENSLKGLGIKSPTDILEDGDRDTAFGYFLRLSEIRLSR